MRRGAADKFLGGRVSARQSREGFRSGIEAVMLAAAVPARETDEVLELGSGAGVASLCLAARVAGLRMWGIEILTELVELARANARNNRMERRVEFVHSDVFDTPKNLRRGFAHVFLNPPFHGQEGQTSPNRERAVALQDAGRLADWLVVAQKRVRANGTMTAIIRADRLAEALGVLPSGGIRIFPLWPRASHAAKRVILQLHKSSRAPLALLPGLVLHEKNGRYTAQADEILRGAASLALEEPRR